MTTSNTGGRALAIAASLAFTIGGLFILLGDTITNPSKWTIYHALTVLTVFGTIAAGHLMTDAKAARHWLAMLGFATLFVAGTGLVVYSSVGRQAETTETKTLSAEATNHAITDTNAELAKARAMLAEAQSDLAKETKRGGCGKTCNGIKTTIAVYEAAVKGHAADLASLGPQKPVNPEAAQMAKLAALFGANEARAVAILILVKPFLWTLFFEVGSIVSIGFAFRRRPAAPSARDSAQTSFAEASFADLRLPTFSGNRRLRQGEPGKWPTPPRGPKRKTTPAGNVIAFAGKHPVISAIEKSGGTVASNRDLARLMGVTDGEASKRVREVAHLVDVCRQGKEIRISLRPSKQVA